MSKDLEFADKRQFQLIIENLKALVAQFRYTFLPLNPYFFSESGK